MKDSAVRQKILEATIEDIEKNGIEACTIRSIAKEADMSFSSLHYYFESKEQLIDEAMRMAIGNSFVDLEDIWNTRTDDRQALYDILLFLFDGALRYPGITRAGLRALLMNGNPDGLVTTGMNTFFRKIIDDLTAAHGLDHDLLSMRLSGAFSSVLYLGIAPLAYAQSAGFDYTDSERRKQYVGIVAATVLQP